jgi:hypothetical protein
VNPFAVPAYEPEAIPRPKPVKGWTPVTNDGRHESTEMLRVAGGWLYRTTLYNPDGSVAWMDLAVMPEAGR